MKVAFVQLKKVNTSPSGGIETITSRLADYIKRRGKADIYKFGPSLFETLEDYDFVHFTISPFQHKNSFLKWYLLKRKVNSAITYYSYSELDSIRNLIKKIVVRSFFDFVIVHSKRSEKMYKKIHPDTHFLNPPVTRDFFNVYKKRDPEHVSFIGRFSRDKGIDRVLGIKGIRLCGYETDISAEMPRLISESGATVIDENPVDVLGKTSVLVLPYRNLDYTVDRPLVVLEAMAAGIPVLTTDVGELPSLLPEECILKKDENMDKKIKYLQNNFDDVGGELHKRAEEMKFSIDDVGKNT